MKKHRLLSSAMLLTAAIIWGLAFVAQEKLADSVPPFTVNALRSLIASVALVPVAAVLRRSRGKRLWESNPTDRKKLIKAGVICGVMLCISVNLQQFGISLYPAGAPASAHSGFLTALYIIFVPLFGLFLHKKPSFTIVIAVILATVGLYFLCLYDGFGALYTGDIVVLICGMAFAVQILCVDHYIGEVDGVKLSAIQFLVTGILSAILMLIFEKPDPSAILAAWKPILYLSLMSSGVGYTLQIIGQKYSDSPALASILMSMESVFAVIGGVIFMHAIPAVNEWIGCGIMLAAIIIAQLPPELFRKKQASITKELP
ncbi:DMT family transporter [Ruminococcus sp.]|uniref:DMT family transporter n=1 Tax=Ruminococcus sp. TaxID=41978 RepID=UPI00388ED798